MVPRTVQMAKEIATQIGPVEVAEYGNIIAEPYGGWSNIYSNYFLGSAGYAPPDTLGRPVMFSYYVHSWYEGQPRWAQPPKRRFLEGRSAILFPVGDSFTPPPLNSLN